MRKSTVKFLALTLLFPIFSSAKDDKFITIDKLPNDPKISKKTTDNHKAALASASHNMSASCYRCGLARNDLIDKEECDYFGYKWDIKTIEELRKSCDTKPE